MKSEKVDRDRDDVRTKGLRAFNRQVKVDSREKLVAAATKLFCRDGYAPVTIEDIVSEAGLSRVTFYRHFPGKSVVALELFQRAAADGVPRMLSIATMDFRDRATVVQWLGDLFASNAEIRGILQVLSQANVEDEDFLAKVQPFIFDLIQSLGDAIPAFAIDPKQPGHEQRLVQAWLLLYTILDQSSHAARHQGMARNPFMIDVLADSFLTFVNAYDQANRPAAGAV